MTQTRLQEPSTTIFIRYVAERTPAIARGELKPKKGDPTVWFTSVKSFAKILSQRNQALLDLISKKKPESLAELEELSGRAKSNLSRLAS